ncbi:MAG: hypothetical protein HZA02_02295 [Nitrospinae bacterium]|nr:hypothetical protein [Nitrospinota bacterium]
MVKLKIAQLKPGMVLAQDVKDLNGRVLLSSGNRLSEKHVKIFKTWGITEVAIERADESMKSGEKPLSGNVDEKAIEKMRQEMNSLFRHTDIKHPAIRELFNLCVTRKLASQAARENGTGAPA